MQCYIKEKNKYILIISYIFENNKNIYFEKKKTTFMNFTYLN